MDGHYIQFFGTVLFQSTAPLSASHPLSVTTRTQPPDWQTHIPTDVLTLSAAPMRVHIALEGNPSETPIVAPLRPVTVTLQTDSYSGTLQLRLYDAHRQPAGVITATLHNGSGQIAVLPRGALGTQWAVATIDGQIAGVHSALFTLDATTEITTGMPDLDRIYPMVRTFMQQDVVSYELDGTTIRGYRSPDNPLIWLRDHVYQGRGFRYFETDMTSTLDAFRTAQYPDGSFPDVLDYPAENVTAHRLEPESDLEYLFVQGVYEAWQATGDDAWLLENLDAMQRGIAYLTSDPLRWDSRYQLVRRPYTIDTWDFQYGPTATSPDGKPSPRHWIDEQSVWGFFHGDNTGLAYALRLLERIERERGQYAQATQLQQRRQRLVERLNDLSWNGSFYTHFVLLDGSLPQIPGVDTAAQLSLSNALALNREVLDFDACRDVLETYHARRDFDRAFAEWYSIDPPFPPGTFGMGGKKGENSGEYVNGGIMPLVGGELARGAFHCGAEEYGFDILRRYAELINLTGASYLWYYPDGRPGISGEHTLSTDGWGAAAMLGALIEGAAGVVDHASRYREIELSPRWGALPDMRQARVVTRYAASDGYVAYTWHYDAPAQRIDLIVTGTWEHAYVQLLLPPDGRDTISRTLLVNGEPYSVEKRKIGTGQYIVFPVSGGNANVQLLWETDP